MDTYNEKEIIALLQDPKRQREAFECIVKQYSAAAILADSPHGAFAR